MAARVVGEERWDALRLVRRVYGNKFYYGRQQVLYDIFYDWPALANMIGIYPKVIAKYLFRLIHLMDFSIGPLMSPIEIGRNIL